MNNNPNGRVRYPVAMLVAAGRRFVKAYNNDAHGRQVLAGLPADFPAGYEAALEALEASVLDQTLARGNVHVLTSAQREGLEDLRLYAGAARQAAKDAFAREDPLLHSDFQVGQHRPNDLSSIILRGRKLAAACRKYAEPLAAQGWPADHTTALEAAIQAIEDASVDQDQSGAYQAGLTQLTRNLAMKFYRQCRAIQCVARVVYPAKKALRDATVREARALFLLGLFPPRTGKTLPPEEPPPSHAPASAPSSDNAAAGIPTAAA